MPPEYTPVDRLCVYCSAPFRAAKPSSRQRYCSRGCVCKESRCTFRKERCPVNVGERFGRLTVMAVHETRKTRGGAVIICCRVRCDCRPDHIYRVDKLSLISGNTRSCGCLSLESKRLRNLTHGGTQTRLYHIWCAMRGRCYRVSDNSYSRYGGRGITVCQEWRRSFASFRRWAMANGYTEDLSIDRIDSNGSYTPSNCRFATPTIQARNKRNNRVLSAFGESKTLTEWAIDPRCSISRRALADRLKNGWKPEAAITCAATGLIRV